MTAKAKRVLIIDDEAIHRETLEVILTDTGAEVTSCERATDALALLRTGTTFDLILTDVMMPGMDGLTFAKEARALAPRIPLILVTGRDSALDTLQAQAKIAICKPYTPETLRAILAPHLELPADTVRR